MPQSTHLLPSHAKGPAHSSSHSMQQPTGTIPAHSSLLGPSPASPSTSRSCVSVSPAPAQPCPHQGLLSREGMEHSHQIPRDPSPHPTAPLELWEYSPCQKPAVVSSRRRAGAMSPGPGCPQVSPAWSRCCCRILSSSGCLFSWAPSPALPSQELLLSELTTS